MGASMTSQAQVDARAGSDGCSGGGHPRSSSNCRAFARGLQVRLLLSDGGFCCGTDCVCGCEHGHGHGSSLQRADKARQEPKAKAKANKSRATQKCCKSLRYMYICTYIYLNILNHTPLFCIFYINILFKHIYLLYIFFWKFLCLSQAIKINFTTVATYFPLLFLCVVFNGFFLFYFCSFHR